MTEIFLLRHAEAVTNLQPHLIGGRSNWAPLSKHGENQADRFGPYMRRSGLLPEVTYSSPAIRSRQTIERAFHSCGIDDEPIIDDRLQELAQGEFEGAERETVYTPEVIAAIRAQQKDFKLAGGESINDVSERMFEWAYDVSEKYPRSIVLAGTHGFAIRCLVGMIDNWEHQQIVRNPIDNVSLTHLTANNGDHLIVHSVGENVIEA